MIRAFGKMLAFEGFCAAALFVVGKAAPELKQQAEQAAKERLREANPELAAELEQLERVTP